MPEIAPNRHDSLPHAEQQVRRAYDRIFKKMLPKVVELGMTTEEAGFVIPQADAQETASKSKRGFGYVHNGFAIREQDMMLVGKSSGPNRSVISTIDIPESEEGSAISMHLYDRANQRKPDIGYVLTIGRIAQLPDTAGRREETIVVDERNGSTYSAKTILNNPTYDSSEPVSWDNVPLLEQDVTSEMELNASALRALVAPIYGEAISQINTLT